MINECGVSTLTQDNRAWAYGVIWSVSEDDLDILDIYEGVLYGTYVKKLCRPIAPGSKPIKAIIYLARNQEEGVPRSGYLNEVIDGARFHGFPKKYIDHLAKYEG